MAVTRIKNNQITDSTITYQKIASGTLVGGLFNANLTLNSNVSIVGNLQVSGNTTTVNSIDTLISDSLITLNNGYVGTPAYDVGILFNRALGSLGNYGGVNAALVWSESDGAFIAVLTTETGTTTGTINRAFKANLIAGNITAANAILAQTATITTLNATNTNLTGLTATGNIVAASGVNATNYTTGALVVPGGGGVGITGDLWVQGPSTFAGNIVAGNIQLSGNINVPVGGTFSNTGIFFGNAGGIGALYAGTSTYTALPTTVLQMSGNVNTYAQVNFQNINSGSSATTDFILTADDGTDSTYYGDFGILGSTYDGSLFNSFINGLGTIGSPNDTYLYAHGNHSTPGIGGNLLIGTAVPGTVLRAFVGGMNIADVVTTTTNSGFRVNSTTTSTSTTSGALIVSGGAGIAGNLYVGGTVFNAGSALGSFAAINATPIGNATPSTGAFTYLTATTGFSTANAVITGGYIQSVANVFASNATIENVNSSNGNVTTLVSTNFSTANARVSGGYIDATPIGANTASTGNFTTANAASVTAYTVTASAINSTSGNITTGDINTLNTVTGNITGLTSTTIDAGTITVATLNVTNGNTSTLYVGNFSTGNARITGGYADNFPIGANTAASGNFTNANAASITAYNTTSTGINSTNGNVVTLVANNFSTANAIINGGNINLYTGPGYTTSGFVVVNEVQALVGQVTSLTASTAEIYGGNVLYANVVTANAWITGGYIDATPIGANAASSGAFTDLSVQGNISILSNTQSIDQNTGALVVGGGVGIAGNLTVGGNLTVQGDFVTLNVATLDVEDYNITVAKNAGSPGAANGAGLTVDGANATLTYASALDSWQLNKNLYGIDTTMVNANVTTANVTNATIGNLTLVYPLTAVTLNVTSGNVTTLVATNFSTANAVVTGGYIDATPIGPNSASTGNFTTANATSVTAYTVNGTIVNVTNGNIATLAATNVSTANAVITGGYADNFPIGANTASTGNFTTANATSVTAYSITGTAVNATNGNVTTLTSTTVNAGTATIATINSTLANVTTGNIAQVNITNGNIVTLVAPNFSTSNARISGGYADNFPIGANTAAPGYFTNLDASNSTKTSILNATSNVYLSPQSGAATVTINPLNPGNMDNMSIGATSAANVYASNFRAATSLWAAPTGPVWIRGGTGTSGINNIPIGAVTPSSGVFTTVDAQTITGALVNATNGNVTTLVATNISTSNAVISGGYISALANAYITLAHITNFSTGNARISGGYADNFPIGANIASTGAFTTLSAAAINGTVIGNATPAAGTFTTLTATTSLTAAGNLVLSGGTTTIYTAAAGTANTTGALIITGTGGAAVNGNVYIGQGAVINGNKSVYDTIVRGKNENSLLLVVADTTYDQVSIGGNIVVANVVQGAKLAVNSTDSILLPVGSSAQRPSGQGYTDVDGMIRFNTTTNQLEYYGNGQWNNTGATYTVIQSRTFDTASGNPYGNVDGSNTTFTLAAEASTAGVLISVNGVLQIPTTAYSMSGNVLTFTEAPAIGDVIDTRIVTTTSSVNSLASVDGYNSLLADNSGIHVYTGNVLLGTIENWRFDTHGDFYPVTTANIGSPSNRVDYFFGSNINLSGGSITGATVSSGSLDDTVIGGNVARQGFFTTLSANSTFTTNAEHVTDDIRGKYVAPGATDAVYGFASATYRSGKFFVQLSDDSGTEYQAAEVICVHNGTTSSIEVYGVTYTGAANLATFSSNIAGGTVYLNASSAGANLAIKVTPTLMKI